MRQSFLFLYRNDKIKEQEFEIEVDEMMAAIPIGIDDFEKVRGRDYYFVDKTAEIARFLDHPAQVTLFTRPRRFGKTMMLSMMKYFLDIEHAEEHRKLFEGLVIAEDKETMAQQGTCPVLSIELKEWQFDTWEDMQERIPEMMSELFRSYRYLIDEKTDPFDVKDFERFLAGEKNIDQCKMALAFLMRLMEAHYGKKVVLLIDEYDAPVQYAWECGYYKKVINFFRRFFSAALKTNLSLDFAILTGVLRITKETIFSGLNNLQVDSLLSTTFPTLMGFTRAEVEKMAEDLSHKDKMPEIRTWYDGYRIHGHEIYNPWSVLKYFKQGCVADAYWVNTSSNSILQKMMQHADDSFLDTLQTLLQGGEIVAWARDGVIYEEIYQHPNDLYTMLLTTGYLTCASVEHTGLGVRARFIIPNQEILSLFRTEVIERFHAEKLALDAPEFMGAFLSGDVAQVQAGLSDYLEILASSFDAANKEAFYHGFVLGLTALLVPEYEVRSNRESGFGRYDIAAFPKKPADGGMVLEFKTAESEEELEARAKEALAQIVEKDYAAEFRARAVADVYTYGIAFYGKHVKVLCRKSF